MTIHNLYRTGLVSCFLVLLVWSPLLSQGVVVGGGVAGVSGLAFAPKATDAKGSEEAHLIGRIIINNNDREGFVLKLRKRHSDGGEKLSQKGDMIQIPIEVSSRNGSYHYYFVPGKSPPFGVALPAHLPVSKDDLASIDDQLHIYEFSDQRTHATVNAYMDIFLLPHGEVKAAVPEDLQDILEIVIQDL